MSEIEQVKSNIALYEAMAEMERQAIVKHETTLRSLHKYLKELEEQEKQLKKSEV